MATVYMRKGQEVSGVFVPAGMAVYGLSGAEAALAAQGGDGLVLPDPDAGSVSGGGSLGIYASTAALESARPAADNTGNTAMVGATAPYVQYISTGTAWVQSLATPRPVVVASVSSAVRAQVTAAATATAASGIAGTQDASPTATKMLAAMVRFDFSSGDNVREININVSSHSGLACGGVLVTINAGDDVIAATRLASGAPDVYTVSAGQALVLRTDVAVTAVHIVWGLAGGSGYTGATCNVLGVSDA